MAEALLDDRMFFLFSHICSTVKGQSEPHSGNRLFDELRVLLSDFPFIVQESAEHKRGRIAVAE